MTGLRLGYIAIKDAAIRDRAKKILFYTASNVASVVQYGGIGALEGPQDCIETFRVELRERRDLFYRGIRESAGEVFSGRPPAGAFYAFLRIDPAPAAIGRRRQRRGGWWSTDQEQPHGACRAPTSVPTAGATCGSASRDRKAQRSPDSMKRLFGAVVGAPGLTAAVLAPDGLLPSAAITASWRPTSKPCPGRHDGSQLFRIDITK
jgi:hypothetical protein